MNIFKRTSAIDKEWAKLQKQEARWLEKRTTADRGKLARTLEGRVPENLQATLDKTFSKAFYYIFEKGTGIIEKTYNREKLEDDFRINDFIATVKSSRKNLKAISKKASAGGRGNFVLSGISGVGLGALGVGLPDILLFTSLILKNVYQLALNYGYDYENDSERQFILLLIQTAVASGDELTELNRRVDDFIDKDFFPEIDIQAGIDAAAAGLSKELLYVKFLQGIPLVGAIGGGYNMVYMDRITKYAEMKYRKRFYTDRRNNKV